MALIPKRYDASKLVHYRSINLCTTMYKICAKLMVVRMKTVLSCLTYLEQGAFVSSCSISDNIFIIQEFMHDLRHTSTHHSLMAIKLDMERAYDRMH